MMQLGECIGEQKGKQTKEREEEGSWVCECFLVVCRVLADVS